MPLDNDYRLTVVESREGRQLDPRQGVARAIPRPSPQAALAAVRATSGVDEAITQVPNLAEAATWQDTAFFSVCTKTGTAAFLDLWDVDHFDFFSDMQSSLDSCRAWFAGDGFEFWGAPQGKTGRVNCHFQAPADGYYLAIASLEGDPLTGGSATTHYILDDFGPGSAPQDLGAFSFTGPVNQPFLLLLSADGHNFRIDQERGGFFFYSLTIYQL
jgi:hypothetical protein